MKFNSNTIFITLNLVAIAAILAARWSSQHHAHPDPESDPKSDPANDPIDDNYCQPNNHSVNVSNLPFRQGELHPCQYAGTIDTSPPLAEHHLFYWFFKNENTSAPLLVWLNGGPGATSMFGLFLENGPLRVERTGPGKMDLVLKAANGSWADKYSIVYLDQPVGTGFSYGNTTLQTMSEGSGEFVKFMVEFLKKYPEYKNRSVYLTGESYAGKYLPLFTTDILKWNVLFPDQKIPIAGTLIIDPYPSPVIQRTHMHLVPRALGLLDQTNLNQVARLEQKCERYQTVNISYGADACHHIMDYINNVSGYVLPYDGRIFYQDWAAIEDPYIDMLTDSEMEDVFYEELHVQNSTKSPVFSGHGSPAVSAGYRSDNLVDYSSFYNLMIEAGYPLMVMAGEFDMQDGIAGQYVWMKQLLEVSKGFWEKARRIYRFYDQKSSSYKVGGYWLSEGNFTLLTVPKSGHFVPANYYKASASFLDDFIENNGKLRCHNPAMGPQNCSVEAIMYEAMDKCNNQTFKDGQCICDMGWKGADCGIKVMDDLHNNEINDKGTKWFYFAPKMGRFRGKDFWYSFQSNVTYDLYVSQKQGNLSNPNEFDYDFQFKELPANRRWTIDRNMLKSDGPLVIAMKVHGYDIAGNEPLYYRVEYFYGPSPYPPVSADSFSSLAEQTAPSSRIFQKLNPINLLRSYFNL